MTTSESESELSDCESISSITSLSSDSSKCDSTTEESTTRFRSRGARYALVIGNNKYRHSSLKSCRKDARDMTKVLSKLGFHCTTIFDASKNQIEDAMRRFCRQIKRNDCALIYFSGHGKEHKDDNYLIPIGHIRSTADDCIPVNSLIKQLSNCSNKLNFIILDACRANKKNGTFKEKAFNGMWREISEKATRSSSSSATTDSVETQFALILSCDPGQVSYDGHSSNSNSRFTEALLKYLALPNLRHDDMMHRVTRELLDKKSKRKQRPWIHSCLHEPFYFNDGSRRFVRERTATSQDLDQLRNKPRLKVTLDGDLDSMAANDKYLLYCPDGSFCAIDADGHEILDVEREFEVYDTCWSSYKNRFLILGANQLYSLNLKTKEYKSVLDFDRMMHSCTCYEDTLLVSRFSSNTIEAYKMTNWKLIQKIKPSDLQDEDQDIRQIRYDSDGSYLGLLVTGRHSKYSFELRNADDLEMLFHRVDLDCTCSCDIVSLTDRQFLISLSQKKKCVLIDTDGELKETINYSKEVQSIAFIGNKKNCLVIQTKEPAKLRFHDLKD